MLCSMSENALGKASSDSTATDKEFAEGFTEWVAGFFDGEGTIKSHARKADENVIGYGVNPQCTLSHQYVGGMFDAEGCIKTGPVKNDCVAVGHHIFPQTVISNNDDTLMAALDEWSSEIGVDCKFYRNQKADYDDTFTFQIQRLDDVKTFLEEIQPYLVVKRKQSQIMLDEIIPLVENGAHLKKQGFLEVMHHVDRLNEGKGHNRGDYTLDYFEDLWDMQYDKTNWFE